MEESAMVTAEPDAKNATEKDSAAAEHMDASVENGNVVFAGTAQITQAQADELLAEYDGKRLFQMLIARRRALSAPVTPWSRRI
ncbi:MAG: hypothetical protein V8R27_08045 [Oscillospiraceae bacterium]